MTKEKRRFFRFPVSLRTVLLTFVDGPSVEVSTENISRGGVGLQLDRQDFQEGALIQMSLKLDTAREPVVFTGKVVWVDREANAPKAGIEITEIDPIQKSELLEKAYKIWLGKEKKNNCDLS